MTAYYNEIDPYCAQWLRNLIAAGHIAPGVVDERSIEDVTPEELLQYTQCHFFAGVGVWSLALRSAGWPDDRRVWTGSCPCQPFSAAGKGNGFTDERHLWPSWFDLIAQCRPAVVFGEQVASKAVDPWIDLVHADLEGMGYAFGGIAFPSAGVGAPHIRDRTFWVADADMPVAQQFAREWAVPNQAARARSLGEPDGRGDSVRMADSTPSGRREERADGGRIAVGDSAQGIAAGFEHGGMRGWLADTDGRDASAERQQRSWEQRQQPQDGGVVRLADSDGRVNSAIGSRTDQRGLPQGDGRRVEEQRAAGPTNGFWRAADWLGCTDGKWRPVEPGTFPLAHGATSRVGRLRAYGNAINAQAAQAFIESYCAY